MSRLPAVVWWVLPLVLLGGFVALLLGQDLRAVAGADIPPVEAIAFERVDLVGGGAHGPGHRSAIVLHVRNDGPDPVHIVQVQVDEAYWAFAMHPEDGRLRRLESGHIEIPYPWVAGEAHEVRLVSETGITFDHEIAVAVESARGSARHLGFFALMGLYVGIIPIAIGLLWFPAMRRLGSRAWSFILSLTVGLLVFLGVDTVEEGLELAEETGEAFAPAVLFVVMAAGMYLLLEVLSRARSAAAAERSATAQRLTIAWLVALGIGLHNLGEGMAIGAAYNAGELALGATLVIGFALHNTTEGLAIVAPIAREPMAMRRIVVQLAGLGALAGAPTIAGAWIGGFAASPLWGVAFMAVGAGAIFQVVVAILRQMSRGAEQTAGLWTWNNLAGVAAGCAVMFATGLLV